MPSIEAGIQGAWRRGYGTSCNMVQNNLPTTQRLMQEVFCRPGLHDERNMIASELLSKLGPLGV